MADSLQKLDENVLSELNDGHIAEVIDRCYLTVNFVESTLLEHALVDAVPAFKNKVEKVQALLMELYKDVAQFDSLDELKQENSELNDEKL